MQTMSTLLNEVRQLLKGESSRVEFKETLPSNSEKYTKTVVAFANGQGGKLIFGVRDETREVVGIGKREVFAMMDSIANAISNTCEPQIVPDIEPLTLDGKTIIIVTVQASPNRPHHIKAKGKESGTYIRAGATSRPATPGKIRDLELEGANISWDSLPCVGFDATDEAVERLCREMDTRRERLNDKLVPDSEKARPVTTANLENWNVIRKTSRGWQASNAFALLTSDHFQFSAIQCGVFKGKERGEFLDKREYSGPLFEQVEEALNFVLRNIRKEARTEGLYREESYELPVDAVREMIVNAVCHRDFRAESRVQVALFDDRLEVTSPGGLYNGITLEEVMAGHTRQRNRCVGNIFFQVGLVEAWGTGLGKIISLAKEWGLPKPEFIEMPDFFRVNLHRKQAGGSGDGRKSGRKRRAGASGDAAGNKALSPVQKRILKELGRDPDMPASRLAGKAGVSERAVKENTKALKDMGLLVRRGPPRGGWWEVRP